MECLESGNRQKGGPASRLLSARTFGLSAGLSSANWELILIFAVVAVLLGFSEAQTAHYVYIRSWGTWPEWSGQCGGPCSSTATPCKFPETLVSIPDLAAADSCIIMLQDNTNPYVLRLELPSTGTVVALSSSDLSLEIRGSFSFQPKLTATTVTLVRFFGSAGGNLKLDFTTATHGITRPTTANNLNVNLQFQRTEITNLRLTSGPGLGMIDCYIADYKFTPSAYSGASRPFMFTGAGATSIYLTEGSFESSDTNQRFNVHGGTRGFAIFYGAFGPSPVLISNVAVQATSTSTLYATVTNTHFTSNDIDIHNTAISNSVVTSSSTFEMDSSSSANDLTATVANTFTLASSTCTRCDISCGSFQLTGATVTGSSSRSTLTAASSTVASNLFGTNSVSNYFINVASSRLMIEYASTTFTNCAFDIKSIFLPISTGTVTLNAQSSLKAENLIFRAAVTLNVANLDLKFSVQRDATTYAGIIKAISGTTTKWVMYSSLTINSGATIDMTGLNELEFQISTADGATVTTDSTALTRIQMVPTNLRINWLIASAPVPGIAYKLFSSSTNVSPTTTVLSWTYDTITYDGLIEKVVPTSSPPGTLGGEVSLRVVRYGLSPNPVYLTSLVSATPYYWDGTSCTTSSTICSSALPCHVSPSLVAILPNTNALCTLFLNPSADSGAYSMTLELPASQSSNQVRVIATGGGLAKGKFTFRKKSAASTSAGVALVGNPSILSPDDGFDFTNAAHGVDFESLPTTFVATFNAKLVNPRIAFSGDTLTFGTRSVVTADATLYTGGQTPITSSTSTSKYVFLPGSWAASSSNSALLPLRLISGNSASVTTSGTGLQMTNWQISSSNIVLASATLSKMTMNATSNIDITQSTLTDSIADAATTMKVSGPNGSSVRSNLRAGTVFTSDSGPITHTDAVISAATLSSTGATLTTSNIALSSSSNVASISGTTMNGVTVTTSGSGTATIESSTIRDSDMKFCGFVTTSATTKFERSNLENSAETTFQNTELVLSTVKSLTITSSGTTKFTDSVLTTTDTAEVSGTTMSNASLTASGIGESTISSSSIQDSQINFNGPLSISAMSSIFGSNIVSSTSIALDKANVVVSPITAPSFSALESNITDSSVWSADQVEMTQTNIKNVSMISEGDTEATASNCIVERSNLKFSGDLSISFQSTVTESFVQSLAQLSLRDSDMLSSTANVSSIVAKTSNISECEISILAGVGEGNSTISHIEESCEVLNVNKLTLEGGAYVTVGGAKVEILEVSVPSTAQLNLISSATIESIKVDGGVLAVLGAITNVSKMEIRGGKILGEIDNILRREIVEELEKSKVLSVSSMATSSKWTIDSNVQLSLANLTIDMAGLDELEYVALTAEGVSVEVSSDSQSSEQVMVNPNKIRIEWNMDNVPVQGTSYTMFSGHGWADNSTEIISPVIDGAEYVMVLTHNTTNGRIGYWQPSPAVLSPKSPSGAGSVGGTKKKGTPYWAWIILAIGLLLILGLIIALVVFFFLKKKA